MLERKLNRDMKHHIAEFEELFEWHIEKTTCELVIAPVLREKHSDNKLVYYFESDELDEDIHGHYDLYSPYFSVNYNDMRVESNSREKLLSTVDKIIKENMMWNVS